MHKAPTYAETPSNFMDRNILIGELNGQVKVWKELKNEVSTQHEVGGAKNPMIVYVALILEQK
uniref:Uncharacterized protein n=1 Tax=Rhizophora mucronata TaxID=61149 RepID=A0A2P2NZS5_RHIMU